MVDARQFLEIHVDFVLAHAMKSKIKNILPEPQVGHQSAFSQKYVKGVLLQQRCKILVCSAKRPSTLATLRSWSAANRAAKLFGKLMRKR